ncbi:Aste57867_2638 [Aphanomyces stellatus]|uniref:Aste57867_2638 protein n=1 Tax=Aphanomyces stellatus TaxID=120398 RepID=A0A485KD71_9STRA|nr:hypothetical protein As57867_002631 [Aphanomyces stellatus]VFT79834.1 Aste57867_2638 [Aphanomyces stellatus]
MTLDDCVHVCVRIRPQSKKEAAVAASNCLRVPPPPPGSAAPTQLVVGKDRPFTFDVIHTAETSQGTMYTSSVTALIEGFMEGYNATVLAYGQTGTGKTYTMTGGGSAAYSTSLGETHGVIPRAVCQVFDLMKRREATTESLLRVEYLEIYNEELRDLLHVETKQLSIREDADGHIVVSGAKSQVVQRPEDVMRLLAMGSAARVTGSTNMNEQSSRSHAIFSLVLQQTPRDAFDASTVVAKLHLVDLAGSERAKRTGAVGGRFKESVSINQGLLALGNVISALGDDAKRKQAHVPYRDSKLTRLLQDSLGGNSRTLMIACVSAAAANFDETLNTLKYANRAKNIKNRPVVNLVKDTSDEVARMKHEIELLQRQLVVPPPTAAPPAAPPDNLLVDEWTAKHKALRRVLHAAKSAASEGAASLVALERDVKALGRPVQQRLNDVVKLLNGIVRLGDKESRPEANDDDHEEDMVQLRAEVTGLRAKLKQDIEIFDAKSHELEQLQLQLRAAQSEIERLTKTNDESDGQSKADDVAASRTSRLFHQRHSDDDDDHVLIADIVAPSMCSVETDVSAVTISTLEAEIASLKLALKESQAQQAVTSSSSSSLAGVTSSMAPPTHAVPTKESKIPVARAQSARPSRGNPDRAAHYPAPPKTADPAATPLDKTSIRAMFQTQLLAAVENRETQAHVASILHEKAETARQKEDAARRKHGLELEKLRQSLSVQSSITDLAQTIHAMNQKMQGGAPDADEVARLKRRKDRAEKKLALFVQKMESQTYVEPAVQEELRALEEHIEDLTSQILFHDAQLETLHPADASTIDHLLNPLAIHGTAPPLDDGPLKQWIQLCWHELVHVSVQLKDMHATAQQQEELVAHLTQHRLQVENGLHAARAEYDRRLVQLELVEASDKKQIDDLTLLLADKQNQLDAAHQQPTSLEKTVADLNHLATARHLELEQAKSRLVDAEKGSSCWGFCLLVLTTHRVDKKRLVEYDRYVLERQTEWESKQRLLEGALEGAEATVALLKQQLEQREPESNQDEAMAALQAKLQSQAEYVLNLEKHVVLFKNKAKQTQLQLQQLIRDSASSSGGNQDVGGGDDGRVRQLEDVNDTLMKENAALKVHVRALKGPDPSSEPHVRIRIPKAELKEVAAPLPASREG